MFDARASESPQYWGAEGILCGVKKLKNLIFAKGREYENMLSQENFEFQLIMIAFWVILHQTHVVITHPVPNAAGNYKVNVLMHTGMK